MRKRLLWVVPALILVAALFAAAAAYQPDAIVRTVVGGAGAPVSGSGIVANGTAGQSGPVGISSGSGKMLHSGFWGPWRSALAAVEMPEAEVLRTELRSNAPNPFNPRTSIEFTLAAAGRVRLEIFDTRGRLIDRLVDEELPAGRHTVVWNGTGPGGRPVASGVYFYRLRADGYESVRKMTLVK